MTIITAAGRMPDLPVYGARIRTFVEEAQAKDWRITECITDGKGDRSLPPGQQPDPDAYTHVVERRADGVVIRGASCISRPLPSVTNCWSFRPRR